MSNCDKGRVAVLGILLLAACSTVPEYQPRGPGELVGYSDMRLSPNRYRVSFSGSASTPDEAEIYLLWRAAEITLKARYTHFVFDSYEAERKSRYSYVFHGPPLFSYPSSSYWVGASWPVITYSTNAEIVLLGPEDAARTPYATDAQSVLQVRESICRKAPATLYCGTSRNKVNSFSGDHVAL